MEYERSVLARYHLWLPSNAVPVWMPRTGIAGYVWPEDQSEHVIYIGDDNNVHELYYVAVEGQDHWWHNQLGPY